jgi:hypothetical protein
MRMRLGDRHWRIRGLSKSSAYATLRLTVFASRGDNFFVDTLELYNARHRAAFLKQAAAELGVDEQVLKSDVGKSSCSVSRSWWNSGWRRRSIRSLSSR